MGLPRVGMSTHHATLDSLIQVGALPSLTSLVLSNTGIGAAGLAVILAAPFASGSVTTRRRRLSEMDPATDDPCGPFEPFLI